MRLRRPNLRRTEKWEDKRSTELSEWNRGVNSLHTENHLRVPVPKRYDSKQNEEEKRNK